MNAKAPPVTLAYSPETLQPDGPFRLKGAWLGLGRVLFAGLFVLSVALFGTSLWRIFEQGIATCDSTYWASWNECPAFRGAQAQLGLTPVLYEAYFLVLRVAAALPFFALSLILVIRRSEELRVLLLAALLAVLGAAGTWFTPLWHWAGYWLREFTLVPFLAWGADLLNFLLNAGGLLFFYLFPTGRFVPRWSRWLAVLWTVLSFFAAFLPTSPLSYATWPSVPAALVPLLFVVSGLGAMLYRYRYRAGAVQRQQIKWVVAGSALLSMNWLIDFAVWELVPALGEVDLITPGMPAVVWELAQDTFWYLSQIAVAICFGVAIFRRRLWDIDLIVHRTLVYAGLTVTLVGAYMLVVAGLGALFQAQGNLLVSLLATGLVALLFQPLREWLQRATSRLLFGQRDDPVTVLSQLGQQLENTSGADAVLPALTETVASALKLPYAAVELEGTIVAAHGQPVGELDRWPLIYQAQTLGHLAVSPRTPGEAFSPNDRRLLANIAHQAGAAAHAVQLTAALRRSRQRIVATREEERRRLRRDLHDGLGPQLASQSLGLDAVDRLVESDPHKAHALLAQLKQQAQAAILDIRRLVHDLRPPALDDLGLRCALDEEVQGYRERGLEVSFESPESVPDLPAAVEVAAYRIAQEALTNVVRHADAHTCLVRLTIRADSLTIEVTDNGRGLPASRRSGVGLQSMRERAEELGGHCFIESPSGGGCRVWAILPLDNLEPGLDPTEGRNDE
jgi:signal transduction histidine kinase